MSLRRGARETSSVHLGSDRVEDSPRRHGAHGGEVSRGKRRAGTSYRHDDSHRGWRGAGTPVLRDTPYRTIRRALKWASCCLFVGSIITCLLARLFLYRLGVTCGAGSLELLVGHGAMTINSSRSSAPLGGYLAYSRCDALTLGGARP